MDATVFVENLTEEQQEALKKERRGRKPKEAISEDAQAMDLVAQNNQNALVERQKINEQFLEKGENYNLHICMEKARMYQEQMSNGMMGLGVQLLLIKHNEVEHGNFFAAIEKLGLSWRAANYAMAAARKFGPNSQASANLGNEKIRALTVLDDDSIKTLEGGGELTGIGTLDDISKMTVRELRAALREEKKKRKEERDAQEAAISQKEKKLNELEMELRYREPPTKEELAQAALDELKKKFFLQVGEASHALHNLMLTIIQAQEIPDVNITQLQGFITLEPEGVLSSIFDYSDTLDEMIENICPARPDTNTEAEEMQYAEPVED